MAVRLFFRTMPFMLLTIAVVLKRSMKMWKVYVLINVFSVLIAAVRSLVYANGIVESIPTNIANSVLYWSCLIEGSYALFFFEDHRARKVLRLSLLLLAITSMTTFIGEIAYPGAVRLSIGQDAEYKYFLFNMGAYSYIYALVFVPVIIFFLIRTYGTFGKIVPKYYLYIILALVFANILLSQFMAALAVAFIGFIAIGNNKRVTPLLVSISVVMIVAYVFMQPLALLVGHLAAWVQQIGMESLHERLNGLSQLMLIGNTYGDISARFVLYQISITHFLRNPLLGLMGTNGFQRAAHYSTHQILFTMDPSSVIAVGQHSDILDLLGGGGLVAFLPFALVIRWLSKTVRKTSVNNLYSLKFIFIGFLQYVVYGIVDHSFSCVDVALAVFVLLPLICKLKTIPT